MNISKNYQYFVVLKLLKMLSICNEFPDGLHLPLHQKHKDFKLQHFHIPGAKVPINYITRNNFVEFEVLMEVSMEITYNLLEYDAV